MSATPGSGQRTSAPPENAPTYLSARGRVSPRVGPVPPLPPAATPTPAGITLITFPRDLAVHNALTEWWYVTGHLQAQDGRRFGFEFTILRVRRENSPTGVLAHFAVTDVDGKRFSHQARSVTGPSQEGFDFNVQG